MDTGLSNKNYLGLVDPAFEDVKFIVECDGSHDKFNLWRDWAPESSTNIQPLNKDLIDSLAIALRHEFWKPIKELNDKILYNKHSRVKSWEQISSGFMIQVGEMKFGKHTLPVCVSFEFAIINGVKVCFYYECSQARNSKMVEDWFKAKFQLTHDNYTRWNHVDSNNFHNCVNSLESIDSEPRDLDKVGLLTPRAIVTNWYPGIKFETGSVLTKIFGNPPSRNDMSDEWRYWDTHFENWIRADTLESARANYKLLEWWENRTEDEMPTQVKLTDGTIVIVIRHFHPTINEMWYIVDGLHTRLHYNDCVPATDEKIIEGV